MNRLYRAALVLFAAGWLSAGAPAPALDDAPGTQLKQRSTEMDVPYLLGPEDELSVQVWKMDQFSGRTFRIDPNGVLHLPAIGDINAVGMSVQKLHDEISERLLKYLKQPEVAVNVVAYHSQPVSVWGSVNNPGLHQLQGPVRLIEMISAAGGARPDAGATLRITRQVESGKLPIDGAKLDPSGQFTTATINLDELTKGIHPQYNVFLRAHDVITVDRAELIYVIGDVKKAGGFTLGIHENFSVVLALSMAEGWLPTAAPKSARIIRKAAENGDRRIDIPIDLRKVLDGKAPDIAMRPDDILYVPNNVPRSIALRSAEIAIQIGTGIVIWGR